jgi:DNA repair protein RecO (recombination protein O)
VARRGGPLQPFMPLRMEWSGRGEVKTLRRFEPSAEAGSRAIELRGEHLYCGFYLNELLARLLPREDAHPWLFGFYQQTLAALTAGDGLETALRRFELALLEQLGHAPDLHADAEGLALEEEASYCFTRDGARRCDPATSGAVHGATLFALARGELPDPRARREAKRLLRQLIGYHLDGRPLKSRELFGGRRRA